jgi:hypothetical protein
MRKTGKKVEGSSSPKRRWTPNEIHDFSTQMGAFFSYVSNLAFIPPVQPLELRVTGKSIALWTSPVSNIPFIAGDHDAHHSFLVSPGKMKGDIFKLATAAFLQILTYSPSIFTFPFQLKQRK